MIYWLSSRLVFEDRATAEAHLVAIFEAAAAADTACKLRTLHVSGTAP